MTTLEKLPEIVSTLTSLAGRLQINRTSLAERLADPRAPKKGKAGWSVFAVDLFLAGKAFEAISDTEFSELLEATIANSDPEDSLENLKLFRLQGRVVFVNGLLADAVSYSESVGTAEALQ